MADKLPTEDTAQCNLPACLGLLAAATQVFVFYPVALNGGPGKGLAFAIQV